MKRRLHIAPLVLLLTISLMSSSAIAEDKYDDAGPSLMISTIGPRELELAVKPYQRCLWRWGKERQGTYRDLRSEMDFENGPPACASEREAFLAKGYADLAVKVPDAAVRKQRVHLQLVGENIEIFGVIVWKSQFEAESR